MTLELGNDSYQVDQAPSAFFVTMAIHAVIYKLRALLFLSLCATLLYLTPCRSQRTYSLHHSARVGLLLESLLQGSKSVRRAVELIAVRTLSSIVRPVQADLR